MSGSAWCGDECNVLYCRGRELQVLCSGGSVLEELIELGIGLRGQVPQKKLG